MSEELDTSGFVGSDTEAPADVPEVIEAPVEAPDAPEEEAEETTEQPKPKKTAQDRIDELTRARREAEREAKYFRDLYEGKPQKAAPVEQVDLPPDPLSYDMGDLDPAYVKATIAYEVRRGLDEVRSTVAKDNSIQAQERVWEARQNEARSEFADFDQKVNEGAAKGDWPCSPEMAEVIKTTDAGARLAYHLASNPDEALRIASIADANSQRWELGMLAGRLNAPSAKPSAKTTTTAPIPPNGQARGAGGQFSVQPDTDDFAAFEKTFGSRFN